MGARQRRLLLAADGADHGDAERAEPLAGDQPDAAGRSMQEHGVAELGAVGPMDQVIGRQALQHHRRGLFVLDRVGQLDQRRSRHDARFGIGAGRSAGIGDAVAGLHIGDAVADRLDGARSLQADAAGQR
jgi:hypothetical protein